MSKRVYLMLPALVCILLSTALADSPAKLFDAVRSNDITIVKAILDKNPKLVNKVDDLKATPLHWAAEWGYLELARLLTSRGASVNARDLNDGRPLHLAARGHLEVSRLLVKQGALIDVRDVDGLTPLWYAIDSDHNEIAKLLMDNGAKLDATFFAEDMTLLHLVTAKGNLEMCRKLIEKGAKVNSVDGGGDTPLHYAAAHGQLHVAAFLVEKGAAVNAKSSEGRTPLQNAVSGNHYEMADLLISKGADVNIRDKRGYSLLHIAISDNRPKLVELLVQHGADVNARAPKPIIAYAGHGAMPKNTQRKTAVPNATQSTKEDVETPLAMALRLKYTDIVEFLRKHGAVE